MNRPAPFSPAHVIAAGCAFPAGPSLPLADIALRTGFGMIRNHPFYVDRCGLRVKMSGFDAVRAGFDAERWNTLCAAALRDLAAHLPAALPYDPKRAAWTLQLVLPDDARGDVPADLAERLRPGFDTWPYPWRQIRVIRGGHAIGVQALRNAALEAAERDRFHATVVLGIDSQLSAAALGWLESQGLLHGAHGSYRRQARANPYGRIPGEAAAAVALTTEPDAAYWCTLTGTATAQEPVTRSVPQPCIGMGLTLAARQALNLAAQGPRPCSGEPVARVTADLNGEPYRADEFGFTALRLAKALAPDYQRIVPALCTGDIGAATAILHTALAAYAFHARNLPGKHLLLAGSDDTLRGAVALAPNALRTANASAMTRDAA